ncbi:MAG TPA: hypothetical protein VH437_04175 [Terriglobales bacterium]|jgi:hypothetical protein
MRTLASVSFLLIVSCWGQVPAHPEITASASCMVFANPHRFTNQVVTIEAAVDEYNDGRSSHPVLALFPPSRCGFRAVLLFTPPDQKRTLGKEDRDLLRFLNETGDYKILRLVAKGRIRSIYDIIQDVRKSKQTVEIDPLYVSGEPSYSLMIQHVLALDVAEIIIDHENMDGEGERFWPPLSISPESGRRRPITLDLVVPPPQ